MCGPGHWGKAPVVEDKKSRHRTPHFGLLIILYNYYIEQGGREGGREGGRVHLKHSDIGRSTELELVRVFSVDL